MRKYHSQVHRQLPITDRAPLPKATLTYNLLTHEVVAKVALFYLGTVNYSDASNPSKYQIFQCLGTSRPAVEKAYTRFFKGCLPLFTPDPTISGDKSFQTLKVIKMIKFSRTSLLNDKFDRKRKKETLQVTHFSIEIILQELSCRNDVGKT